MAGETLVKRRDGNFSKKCSNIHNIWLVGRLDGLSTEVAKLALNRH